MTSHQSIIDHSHSFLEKIGSRRLMITSEVAVSIIIVSLLVCYHFVMDGPINYWMVVIPIIGFGLSLMDSCIGMGYGTIGSPLLIILGFSSKLVVPSILISQAVTAVIASTLHQRRRNVNYFDIKGNDLRIVSRLISFGLIGTIIGAVVAVQLSKAYLNTYIGLLVIAMGVLLLLRPSITFTWLKVNLLSLVSGFNKAMSGGGYGPVATTGLLVSGNPVKNSVGATLFSVIFINITSFIIFLATKSMTSFQLPIFLTIGVLVGSQLGPRITGRFGGSRIAKALFAFISMTMGMLTIFLTFVT